MATYAIEIADVEAAASRLDGVAHRTPVVTCGALDRRAGRRLFFKCEHLQRVGAFKFRGAWNAVSQLDPASAAQGVVTHSSGNHAQALALAARERGVPAHIVMPRNACTAKVDAVREYGARVTLCEPRLEARDRGVEEILATEGGVFVPPYDHPHIMAGQGTVALELLAQVPELDAIVAPIGGGGLVSGIAIATHARAPRVRVFGAEPAGADDAARSKATGEWQPQTAPDTVCDGLLSSTGSLSWPVFRDRVYEIGGVCDEAVVESMRLLWERAKLLVEPSAAVALAVALSPSFRRRPGIERIGVVLSGGNVDLDRLPWQSR